MKKINVIVIIILLAITFSCSGTNKYPKDGILTGTIREVGNAPHVEIVISGKTSLDDKPRDYYVIGNKLEEMKEFIYHSIEANGTIDKKFIRFAKSEKGIDKYTIDIKKYKILDKIH